MATLPGSREKANSDLRMSPELLQELLGDPAVKRKAEEIQRKLNKQTVGGRDKGYVEGLDADGNPTMFEPNPNRGTVSTNMSTGERRMLIPPADGRKAIPKEEMYKPRPSKSALKKKRLPGQSLAEQEMVYDIEGGLTPEAQLGPGAPIIPYGQEAQDHPENILRAQATNTPEAKNLVDAYKKKGMISPRNVPIGMEDYDINQGRGGQVPGVDTVAGTAAVEEEMAMAVQEFEATGRMPDGSDKTVMQFIRLYGRDHPLYKRMAELADVNRQQ
jgi:hypothetical protein